MKFYICGGMGGVYHIHQPDKLKFVSVVDTPVFTLCCNNTESHNHEPGVVATFSEVINKESTHLLASILNNNVACLCSDEIYYVDVIKRVLDYCFATIAHMQYFYSLCNQLLENTLVIKTPRTLFGIFKVLHTHVTTDQNIINMILNDTTIHYVDRLLFTATHNDIISPFDDSKIVHTKVCAILGLSQEILEYLSPDRVVIAGGATMKLYCDWTNYDLCSDVDIFILSSVDEDERLDIIYNLCSVLRLTGRVLARSGESVIHAIGEYGQRSVQIIMSTATSTVELINKFDINLIKCAYDGTQLFRLCSAHYDHITHVCSNGKFTHIIPLRLAKISLKGFKLNQLATEYLKSTVGWPLPLYVVNMILHKIPHITPTVPVVIQEQNLLMYNLCMIHPGGDLHMRALTNSYGAEVFTGELIDYGKTVYVTHISATDIYVYSEYAIALPQCTFPYNAHTYIDDTQHMIIINDDDRISHETWVGVMISYMHNISTERFILSLGRIIRIIFSTDCVWMYNGIRLTNIPEYIPKNARIESTGTPVMINYNGDVVHGLIFKLHTVSIYNIR